MSNQNHKVAFFNDAEQAAADKLIGSLEAASCTPLADKDPGPIVGAYESLCRSAAVRHSAIDSCGHLAHLKDSN